MNDRKLALSRFVAVLVCSLWVVLYLIIGLVGFIPMAILFAACTTSWKVVTLLGEDSSSGNNASVTKKPEPKPFAGFQDIPNSPESKRENIKQITHQP